MIKNIIQFEFQEWPDGPKLAGEIRVESSCIAIAFDGYSTHYSEGGSPLWIEFYQSKLQLSVFGDVTDEDPQVISLEGAREALYEGSNPGRRL